MRLCSTPGCGRKHYAHGLCQPEYLADRRRKPTAPVVAAPPQPRPQLPPPVPPRRSVPVPAPAAPATFLAAGSLAPADGPSAVIVSLGSVDL